MTNILAIETSTAACSVALEFNGKVYNHYEVIPREHGKVLLLWINELLEKAGASLQDLDALAFGCGPGGFTGVRIGIGVIQGLALGAELPLISISSLAALAQNASDNHDVKNALIIQDAKMGEVYWGAYSLDNQQFMKAVIEDQLSPIENVSPPAEKEWVRIGDMTDFDPCYPTALAVLKLAKQKFSENQTVDVSDALPVYLRDKDAWKKIK